jgi:hypothetical protein
MIQAWGFLAFATNALITPPSFPIQFAHGLAGREVMICIDGKVEKTFAGKMGFRDQAHAWSSVCADVRSPVGAGETFTVQALSTATVGGNYAMAGNIVAKYFNRAQAPDECAGLQLAVWKVIEDGYESPNFLSGHFQAQASPAVMIFAREFYAGGYQNPQAGQIPTHAKSRTSAASHDRNNAACGRRRPEPALAL